MDFVAEETTEEPVTETYQYVGSVDDLEVNDSMLLGFGTVAAGLIVSMGVVTFISWMRTASRGG